MKRKISSLFVCLGIMLSSASCQLPNAPTEEEGSKSRQDTGQWLSFIETQCANPWGYCNKIPETTNCVKEHLEKLGVTVLEVTVSGKLGDGAVCMACQCPSGRIFKVSVNPGDVEKVVAVGFKKI